MAKISSGVISLGPLISSLLSWTNIFKRYYCSFSHSSHSTGLKSEFQLGTFKWPKMSKVHSSAFDFISFYSPQSANYLSVKFETLSLSTTCQDLGCFQVHNRCKYLWKWSRKHYKLSARIIHVTPIFHKKRRSYIYARLHRKSHETKKNFGFSTEFVNQIELIPSFSENLLKRSITTSPKRYGANISYSTQSPGCNCWKRLT